jgi:signal transduction histidine kinase
VSGRVNPDGTVRIFVTDNGPGMTPEQQNKVFQPFERASAKFSNIEGTGIGLTICEELMKRMGGSIGLESEPNKGSTFWIDIKTGQ